MMPQKSKTDIPLWIAMTIVSLFVFFIASTDGGNNPSPAASILEQIEISHESIDAIIFICFIYTLKYLPFSLAVGWALQRLIVTVRSNGKKE